MSLQEKLLKLDYEELIQILCLIEENQRMPLPVVEHQQEVGQTSA